MYVKPLMRFVDMKHSVLISPTDSKLVNELNEFGITEIKTEPLSDIYDNEKYHADMQCLKINDVFFIPEECKSLAKTLFSKNKSVKLCRNLQREYPQNVSLNALYVDNKLLCKESALDENVRLYCDENDIKIINVNQGYAKCSALVLGDKAIITADPSIYKAAINNDIPVMKISVGNILLDDADYGFIGGASGVVGDTVFFFGDITKHPDCNEITEFIKTYGFHYKCLTEDMLHDVGGFVLIE